METTEVVLVLNDASTDDDKKNSESSGSLSKRGRSSSFHNDDDRSSKRLKLSDVPSPDDGDKAGDLDNTISDDASGRNVLLDGLRVNPDGSLITHETVLAMTPGKKYSAQFVGNGTTYIEDLEVGNIQLPSTPSENVSRDYTLANQFEPLNSGGTGTVIFYGLGWSPNWVTQDGDYIEVEFAGRYSNTANVKNVGVHVGQGVPPLNSCSIPAGTGGSFIYKGTWMRDGVGSCRCSAQIVYSNGGTTGSAMASTLTSHAKDWSSAIGEITVVGINVITAGDITPLIATLRLRKVTTVV